jgi:hypothetical protein
VAHGVGAGWGGVGKCGKEEKEAAFEVSPQVGVQGYSAGRGGDKSVPGEKKTELPRSTGVRGLGARCNCN